MSRPVLIGRRRFLGLAGGAATSALLPRRVPASEPLVTLPSTELAFSVWRNGSEIGSHTVDFEKSGEWTSVRSEVNFAIKFGPITLYRYHYQALELWRGEELQSLRAHTNDNGEEGNAEAKRVDDLLVVVGSKSGKYTAPAGAIAATHWNPAELDQPMINPQNGELMRFERRDLGRENLASGVAADHVALSGYATLDLWYDDEKRWSALRAIAKDRSVIDYRPR